MKLGKVLMILAILLTLGAAWFVLFNKKVEFSPSKIGQDDFLRISQVKRGDDPTYSEEIRKNTALMLDTQQLQQKLQNEFIQAKNQSAQATEKLEEKIRQLTRQLEEIKNTDSVADKSDLNSVKNQLDNQIEKMTNTIVSLSEQLQQQKLQNEENLKVLEEKFKSQQENKESSIFDDEVYPKNDTTQPPKEKRQKFSPYGGGGVTLPYGRSPTSTNMKSDDGDFMGSLDNLTQGLGKKLVGMNEAAQSSIQENEKGRLPTLGNAKDQQKEWPTIFPVYTIPPNTILGNAKLITPMIGQVPIAGNDINDPFFFKVEIGKENLAANGQSIPGIAKMIASGYATGLAEQECARGYIDSMTFIFIDGRIVTTGQASGEGHSNDKSLGYLSDPWGKPCISGQYINNANQYLKSRAGAAFLEAAAAGLAMGETTVTQNQNGNYQAVLDGNVYRYLFGRGLSSSAAEIAQYVRERTANAFDIVYVPQGKSVQIMINSMIPIDYDANGRKVNYYNSAPTPLETLD